MFSVLLNFTEWWYLVQVKNYWEDYVLGRFIYNLNLTNTLPMARHITQPMFQDNSGVGRLVSIFIRFWWVGIGSVISLITTIPFLVFGLVLVVLPLIPFFEFIVLLLRQL